MGRLSWLSDRQFELIKPHLPYRAAGKRREDDRRIISGIIHVLQSGCRWRDCPPEYGPYIKHLRETKTDATLRK